MALKQIGYFLLLVTVVAAAGRHEKYEGHHLYLISGPNQEILNLEPELDFFKVTAAAPTNSEQLEVLARIPPQEIESWINYFSEKNLKYKVITENLAEILRNEDFQLQRSRERIVRDDNPTITWDTYYTYEEINNHLDSLAEKYPELVTLYNAALSYEGRQIKYLRISTSRFEDLKKPVVIVNAGANAREWITTSTALYIINQLVVDIADNTLTEEIDWIIIPLANPDGYEYAMDQDRAWQKTRSKSHIGSDECPGVNIESNFDISWGTLVDNRNPCSKLFEGPAVFSEPESRLVRDVIRAQSERAFLYLSIRSGGGYILYPWGNNGTLPLNGIGHHLAGIQMAAAMDAVAENDSDTIIVGNAAQILSEATGTSRDYARDSGVIFAYDIVLQGKVYGFLVPCEKIQQTVIETWAGVAAAAKYILTLI